MCAVSHDALILELTTNLREDFTITEKAPTWAFCWLKAPSRGLLRDCENFAEGSFASLLPELGGGG